MKFREPHAACTSLCCALLKVCRWGEIPQRGCEHIGNRSLPEKGRILTPILRYILSNGHTCEILSTLQAIKECRNRISLPQCRKSLPSGMSTFLEATLRLTIARVPVSALHALQLQHHLVLQLCCHRQQFSDGRHAFCQSPKDLFKISSGAGIQHTW